MSYDDVEMKDMERNEELRAPYPCGDLFQITKEDLRLNEEIARCTSYSLYITVVYNLEDFIASDSKNNVQPSKQQLVAVA